MSKARYLLAALVVLGGRAAGDATGGGMPSAPFPALAAAPLVYTLVPSALGARTWAERHLEQIRLGLRAEVHEDLGSVAALILLSVHPQAVAAYALALTEAPPEGAPEGIGAPVAGTPDFRVLGALEALGLTPEDLVGAPETPLLALKAASTIEGALDWSRGRLAAFRRLIRGQPSLEVERPQLRASRPDFVRFEKPAETMKAPPLVFAKGIVRSVYKMMLGVAIGILIWGLVRQSQ